MLCLLITRRRKAHRNMSLQWIVMRRALSSTRTNLRIGPSLSTLPVPLYENNLPKVELHLEHSEKCCYTFIWVHFHLSFQHQCLHRSFLLPRLAQIPLGSPRHNSTCLTCRASRDKCVEPCCSNMADDEQARVLACTSLVVFVLLHTQILFVPSTKIN